MKFYKRDPDAALSGMAELTLQERGAYNTIIDLLYSRDGLLPDNDDLLRCLLRCHGNEWRAVKIKLIEKGKLWSEGGYLKANRVDSVLKEAGNFSETQRIRAGKRWETAGIRPTKSDNFEQNQSLADAKAKMPLTPTPTPTPITSLRSVERGKGTRWPTDEIVCEGWRTEADAKRADHGLSQIDVNLEAEKFRNHWLAKSGQNGTKLDWHLTWINWALRAETPRTTNGHGKPTAHDNFIAGAYLAADEYKRPRKAD